MTTERESGAPVRHVEVSGKGPRVGSPEAFSEFHFAGLAVAGSILALTAARLALGAWQTMWLWGLNLARFLGPLEGWSLTALSLTTLLPPVARPASQLLDRVGDSLARRRVAWLAAIALAALIGLMPDRTWLTGDFLLRDGAAETGSYTENFSQSLPLELLLNRELPKLGKSTRSDPNQVSRALGALEAAGLVIAAIALSREWALGGAARVVAIAITVFGGYLAVFTGIAKPAPLLCVLTVTIVLAATRLLSSGRGGALLGFSLATALLAHRSALVFLPTALAAVVGSIRREEPRVSRDRREILLAIVPPVVVLALLAPRLVHILTSFDLPSHLLPATVRGNPLAAAFGAQRLLDLANLALIYAPMALPALLVVGPLRRSLGRDPAFAVLVTLLVSHLPVLLFIHPIQGMFRDLEVFAPTGVALALFAAFVLGSALERRVLARTLAPALIAASVIPALQWPLHFADAPRGIQRARAFGVEAPRRTANELAQLWDLLAYRGFRLGDWTTAVGASEQSVHYAPHRRAFLMLALAQTSAGDHRAAQATYLGITERDPGEPLAWLGLMGESIRLGDTLNVGRARQVIDSYPAGGSEVRALRRHLREFPIVWPKREELERGPIPR